MARGSTVPAQSGMVGGQNRREEGAARGKRLLHHLAPLARGLLLAALLGLTLLAAAVLGMEEQDLVALVSPSATEPETATAVATPTATRPKPTPTPTATMPPSSPTPSPVPPSVTPQPTVRRRIYVTSVSPRPVCTRPSGWVTYVIQWGDTLSSIARRRGTTPEILQKRNCLPNTHILAGRTLWVPRLPWSSPTPTPTSKPRTSTPPPNKTPVETPTASDTPEPSPTKATEPPPTDKPTTSPPPTNTPAPSRTPEPTATPKPTLSPTTAPSPTPLPTKPTEDPGTSSSVGAVWPAGAGTAVSADR